MPSNTPHAQTVAQLRYNEQLVRIIIDTMPGGIVHVGADGAIITANATALAILGLAYDEITQRYTQDFETQTVWEDGTPCPVEDYPVSRALMTGEAQPPATIGVRRPDGETSWAVFTAAPVRGPVDDTVTGAIVTFLDLTERKQAEVTRAELERRLAKAERLEAIGRLAGGVAHDFNNIMMVVMGHAEVMRSQTDQHPEILAHAMAIVEAADRAADLTQHLLAFGGQQPMQPRKTDVNAVVAGLGTLLRDVAGPQVSLVIDCAAGLGPARADRTQLERVLLNLVTNARDAVASQGTITVSTRVVTLDPQRITTTPPLAAGDYVAITVSDDGHGISTEQMTRLFEPFYTTREQGFGHGLGLATVHGIVSQSGGGVAVASTVDRGSAFTVYLPACQAPHAPPAITARSMAPRVMLVDDEDGIRRMLALVMRQHGFEVVEAANPSAALALAPQHPFDILVSDIVMPGASGRSLAEALRAQRPDLPVIFITGFVRDSEGLYDPDRGPTEIMEKPFDPQLLIELVERMCGTRP